jgi:glycerol-3-phosphate dehydrogenase
LTWGSDFRAPKGGRLRYAQMVSDERTYDVVVVGGGVNGAGIARDLSLRGVSVALFDRDDICGATTGASSGMIHGGMRYLLYDRDTTKHSCIDSGYIQRIAPHLIFRIPFLLPLFGGRAFSKLRHETVEAFFRAYDEFQPLKGGKPHTRLTGPEALAIEPGIRPDVEGAVSMDEWGIDTFRLVLLNALDAAEHGAKIHTYKPVVGLVIGQRREVLGVRVQDRAGGPVETVRAKVVVNAAGPWVPALARMAGCEVRLRPSKGVHLTVERRISNTGIIAEAVDGRSIFVQPHENTSIIGTTDDDYYGDPGNIPIAHDEVEYLLEAAERVFPSIREYKVLRAWAGVRPTLYADGRYEDDLSRRHEVFDHAMRDGVANFVTLGGGKLAAYRIMAQETTDLVMQKLGRGGDCRTHREPLPGGDHVPDPTDVAKRWALDRYAAARLVFRHGSRVDRVLEECGKEPASRRIVCRSEPVTEAEIRWACRHEWVKTLEDLRRRTRFAEGPCQGLECVREGARIVAEELGWGADETDAEVVRFLDRRWRERYPTLRGRQLAEEELLQGTLFGVEGYDRVLPERELS